MSSSYPQQEQQREQRTPPPSQATAQRLTPLAASVADTPQLALQASTNRVNNSTDNNSSKLSLAVQKRRKLRLLSPSAQGGSSGLIGLVGQAAQATDSANSVSKSSCTSTVSSESTQPKRLVSAQKKLLGQGSRHPKQNSPAPSRKQAPPDPTGVAPAAQESPLDQSFTSTSSAEASELKRLVSAQKKRHQKLLGQRSASNSLSDSESTNPASSSSEEASTSSKERQVTASSGPTPKASESFFASASSPFGSAISAEPTPRASGSKHSSTDTPDTTNSRSFETAAASLINTLGTLESLKKSPPRHQQQVPTSQTPHNKTSDDLFPSSSRMAAMAATPKASHRRHAAKRTPQAATVSQAKELLQQQQQQQQRKLQQLQQDHYQKTSATIKPTVPALTKTPQEQRTFQQQYMEQQAQLDRQTAQGNRNNNNNIKPKRGAGSDDEDLGNEPQAKLVGAATAMSTSITFAMHKFQELLQPSAAVNGTNSRLVYTATSESFTSSMVGEEKKDDTPPDDEEPVDSYDDAIDDAMGGCTSMYSSKSRRRHHKRRTNYKRRNHHSGSSSILSAPSAVSATSSILSGMSSVTGGTTAAPSPISSFVEEISPMMRMRHPRAQHNLEITASSSDHGASVSTSTSNVEKETVKKAPSEATPDESLQQSSSTFKTEEQVKAEKQRKWKKKMKIAQQQQQQEHAELGEDSIYQGAHSYSQSIDEDDEDFADDDASDVSFGCRPGSNLAEIWSSISGNLDSKTIEAATKNPVDVFQKVLSARCGIELTEVSSSEGEEEEDGGYSFSDDDEEDKRQEKKKKKKKKKKKAKTKSRGDQEVEGTDEEDSQDGARRGRKTNGRGRSRRPRSKSHRSQSNRTGGASVQSQSSRTSKHSETSLGDILGQREDELADPHSERDRAELQLLQQKPNFRILGKKTADTTVMSSGSTATPIAGTASTCVSVAGSILSEDSTLPQEDSSKAPEQAASVFSDSPSKGNLKKTPSVRSVKSVSFDESTITKASSIVSIPTVVNLDRSDPSFIRNFVSGMSHHGVPLLWHRSPAAVDTAGSSNASVVSAASSAQPESVVAYLKLQSTSKSDVGGFEDGFGDTPAQPSVQLPTTWDSPRLVWYRETISSFGLNREELGHIDLFDIASIGTAHTMSSSFLQVLEAFPYSMPSRTLVLQLNRPANPSMYSTNPEWFFPSESPASAPTNMVVLEASSDDAAMTMVLGMKWMIARLAFNLIVGNMTISCELLRPEQHQPALPEDKSCGEEDSIAMGPTRRPPILRRTKVMNDVTFHMLDKILEKSSRYQTKEEQQQELLTNEFSQIAVEPAAPSPVPPPPPPPPLEEIGKSAPSPPLLEPPTE